jgi:hypothetical protein
MHPKSEMHGPTAREMEMLSLDEDGKTAAEISEIMGLKQSYIEARLFGLSMNDTQADLNFFAMVRRGTEQLGHAVNLAGGHR